MATAPNYPLADLLQVCFHATPYALPLRTLGHQIVPKWFAPRLLPPNMQDELHGHNLYEAQICLAGRGFFTLEGTQDIGPGAVAMYPPLARHTLHTGEEGGMFLWAGFLVEPAVRVTEPLHWPLWPAILQDLDIMMEESRLRLRGWAERAGLRLSLILARLLTLAEARPDPHPVPMNYAALVQEVDRYCEMYYAQPIRLEDVADYFQMSPRTLMRQYQRLTGLTIMAYLRIVRLRKAAWLLRQSALSISAVAAQCGMEPNYFSRVFRDEHGVTPGQFRMEGEK
jgi:AraC-like DNA-binding protein